MSAGDANERMRSALILGVKQCEAFWAAVPNDAEAALLTRTRVRRLPNMPMQRTGLRPVADRQRVMRTKANRRMKLPERIPKVLRDSAIFLPEFGDGEAAWSRGDAMAVVESLKSTTIVVSDVVLFERVSWGYAPSESGVSIDRLPDEAEADYAKRSRSSTADFIRNCSVVSDDALFGLTFPLWKDAA